MNQCDVCRRFIPKSGEHDCRDTTGEVLAAVGVLFDKEGYPPSIQEVADYVGVSKSTVYNCVVKLEEHGMVQHTARRYRTLRPAQPRTRAGFR